MQSEITDNLKMWARALPSSEMVYPESFGNRLKYFFWRFYTPYHPFFRDALVALSLVAHTGRQNFLLGKVAPRQSIEEFVSFLVEHGYGNHFIALVDEGELISLRYVKDFVYQYHLRIFEDGEVRGHYEYTPECYPISHVRGVNMEDRRDEFLSLLGNRIISSA